MVLESYLSSGLSSVLSNYIQDIPPNHISLLLTTGKFELTDLSLNLPYINKTVLGSSPLLLTHGTLGRLQVGLQWKTLLTSAFGVHIDDLHLVLAVRPTYCIDESVIEEQLQAAKQQILDTLQQTLLDGINTDPAKQTQSIKPPPGTGLILRVAAAMINTFQFTLNGLHLAIDHNTVSSSVRSQAEIAKLAGIDDTTTANDSAPSTLHDDIKPVMHIALNKFDFRTNRDGQKDIEIDQFCVFVTQPDRHEPPPAKVITSVYRHATQSQDTYLLYPFSTLFKMHFDNKSAVGLALRVVGTLAEIRSQVGVAQSKLISDIVTPMGGVSARIANIQTHIKEQWQPGSDAVRERYIQLYKAQFNALWLDPWSDEDKQRVQQIEHQTTQESLELWRAYAIAELRFELSKRGDSKVMKREATVSTVSKLVSSVKTMITGHAAEPVQATARQPPNPLTAEQRDELRQQVVDSNKGAAPEVASPVDQTSSNTTDELPTDSNPDQTPSDELDIPLLKPILLDVNLDIQRIQLTIVDDQRANEPPIDVFQLVIRHVGMFGNLHDNKGSFRIGMHALYMTDVSEAGSKTKQKRPVLEQFRHLIAIESDLQRGSLAQPTTGMNALKDDRSQADDSTSRPDIAEADLLIMQTLPVFLALEWRADGMDSGREQVGHAQVPGTAQHVSTSTAIGGENKHIKTHTTVDVEVRNVTITLGSSVGSLLRLLRLDDESVAAERRSAEKEKRRAMIESQQRMDVIKDRLQVEESTAGAAQAAAGGVYAAGIPNVPLPSVGSPLGIFPLVFRLRVAAPMIVLPVDAANPQTTAIMCTATIAVSTRLTLIESERDVFNTKKYYINANSAIDIIAAQVFVYDYKLNHNKHEPIRAHSIFDRIFHLTKLQVHHVLYPTYYDEQSQGPTALQPHPQLATPSTEEAHPTGSQSSTQDIKLNITQVKVSVTSRAMLVLQTYVDSLPLPALGAGAPDIITDPVDLNSVEHDNAGSDDDSEVGDYHHSSQPSNRASYDSLNDDNDPANVVAAVERYIREKEQTAVDQVDDEDREFNNILTGRTKQRDEEVQQFVPAGNGAFSHCTVHVVVDDVDIDVIDDFGQSNNNLIQVRVYDVDLYLTSFLHNRNMQSTVSIRIDAYNNQRCAWEPVVEPMSVTSRLLQHYTICDQDASEMIAESYGRSSVFYPLQTQISITPSQFIDLTVSQAFLRSSIAFGAKLAVVNRQRAQLAARHDEKSANKLQQLLKRRSKDETIYKVENCTELPIHFSWLPVKHQQQDKPAVGRVLQQLNEPLDTDVKQTEAEKLKLMEDLQNDDQAQSAEENRQAHKVVKQISEIHQLNRDQQAMQQYPLGDRASTVEPYSSKHLQDVSDDDNDEYQLRVVGLKIGQFPEQVGISLVQPDTIRHAVEYRGVTVYVIVEMYVDVDRCTRVVRVRGLSGLINHTQETVAVQAGTGLKIAPLKPGGLWWLPVLASQKQHTAETLQLKPIPDEGPKLSPADEALHVAKAGRQQHKVTEELEWSDALLFPTTLRQPTEKFRHIVTSPGVAEGSSSMSVIVHADNITGPRCPEANDPCMSVKQKGMEVHGETTQPEQMQDPQALKGKANPQQAKAVNNEANNYGTLYCIHPLVIVENLTLSKLNLKWIPIPSESRNLLDKVEEAVGLQSKATFDPNDPTRHSKANAKLHKHALNTSKSTDGRDNTIDIIDVEVDDLCHIYDNDMLYNSALSIGIPEIFPGYWSDPIPFHVKDQEDHSGGYKQIVHTTFKQEDGKPVKSEKYVDRDFTISLEVTKLAGINAFHVVIYHEYWLFNLSGLSSKELGFSVDKQHILTMKDFLERLPNDNAEKDHHSITAVPIDFPSWQKHHYLYCGSMQFEPSKVQWSQQAIDLDAVKEGPIKLDVRRSPDTHAIYNLTAVINVGQGRHHRTKVCTLQPSIFIVNTLSEDIVVRQINTNSAGLIVPAKQQIVWHFTDTMGSNPDDKQNVRLVQMRRSHAKYDGFGWSPAIDPDDISGDTVMGVRHSQQRDMIWFARAQIEVKQDSAYVSIGEHVDSATTSITTKVFHRAVNHTVHLVMRFRQIVDPKHGNKYDVSRDWLEVYPLQQLPYAYQYLRDGQKAVTVEVCPVPTNSSHTTELTQWHKLGDISLEDETIDQKHDGLYLSLELNGPKHVLYLRDYPSKSEDEWTQKQLGLTVPRPMHSTEELKRTQHHLTAIAQLCQAQCIQLESERNQLLQKLKQQHLAASGKQLPPTSRTADSKLYLRVKHLSSKQSNTKNYRLDLQVNTLPVMTDVQHDKWQTLNAQNLSESSSITVTLTRKKSLLHRHEKVVARKRVTLEELQCAGERPVRRTIDIKHSTKDKSYQLELDVQWQQSHQDSLTQEAVRIAELEDYFLRVCARERQYRFQTRLLQQRGQPMLQQRIQDERQKAANQQNELWAEFRLEVEELFDLQRVRPLIPDTLQQYRLVLVVETTQTITTNQGIVLFTTQRQGHMSSETDIRDFGKQPVSFFIPRSFIRSEVLRCTLYLEPLQFSHDADHVQDVQVTDTKRDMEFLAQLPHRPVVIASCELPLATIPITADLAKEHRESRDQQGSKGDKSNGNGSKSKAGGDNDTEHGTTDAAGKRVMLPATEQQIQLDKTLQDQNMDDRDASSFEDREGNERNDDIHELTLNFRNAAKEVGPLSMKVHAAHYQWPELKHRPHVSFSFYMPRFGLSIINETPEELLYISVDSLLARIQFTSERMGVQLAVNGFQVDNQLPDALFPVMVGVKPSPPKIKQPTPPVFQLALAQKISNKTALELEFVTLQMQQLLAESDEDILLALVNMLLGIIAPGVETAAQPHTRSLSEYQALIAFPAPVFQASIHKLIVQPIQIELSFEPIMAQRDQLDNDLTANYDVILYLISTGAAFASTVERAPVRIPGHQVDNLYGTGGTLAMRLFNEYKSDLLWQILLVGSNLNALGQPTTAYQKIVATKLKLLHERSNRISPHDSAANALQGGNLPQRIWQAGFGSGAAIFSSLAGGFATLSMDSDYAYELARRRHNQPNDPVDGFKKAGNELLNVGREFPDHSHTSAAGKAAATVMGAVGKPLAGTLAATSQALKGVGKIADPGVGFNDAKKKGYKDTKDRVRPQRAIVSGVTIPYLPKIVKLEDSQKRN